MSGLGRIRLAAVDCDGVLIDDTYLAVIEQFVTAHGGLYDDRAERAIIGRNDLEVAGLVARLCGLDAPASEVLAAMWAQRERYLADHPITVAAGASTLLSTLRDLGLRVICYGGRTREHTFDRYLGHLVHLLDPQVPYVSVNEHRPGVDWIVREVVGCAFDQAVFVDDVVWVAQAARAAGAGFIGVPGSPAHQRQRRFMAELGARTVVSTLDEVTPGLLAQVDAQLAAGSHWPVRP